MKSRDLSPSPFQVKGRHPRIAGTPEFVPRGTVPPPQGGGDTAGKLAGMVTILSLGLQVIGSQVLCRKRMQFTD